MRLGGFMAFKKDGETKVYKDMIVKSGEKNNQQKVEKVRYTIDDLVKDSDATQEESESGESDVL
jgi:hypothetical protein